EPVQVVHMLDGIVGGVVHCFLYLLTCCIVKILDAPVITKINVGRKVQVVVKYFFTVTKTENAVEKTDDAVRRTESGVARTNFISIFIIH
ncbi:hypothetical protein, partial [Moheibacter sediminis]